MPEPTDKLPNQPKKSTPLNNYLKYSAFGFQMIGVFVALSLGGNWLDKHFSMHFPAFTLAGVLLALISVFYFIFKLIRNQD